MKGRRGVRKMGEGKPGRVEHPVSLLGQTVLFVKSAANSLKNLVDVLFE